MKRKIISITFIAAIAVAAAWNFNQSSNAGVELSDIALANVEALARIEKPAEDGEGGGQQDCYSTITTNSAYEVRYCATCTMISGHAALFAPRGTC
jgi:hypothetical protein